MFTRRTTLNRHVRSHQLPLKKGGEGYKDEENAESDEEDDEEESSEECMSRANAA